MNHKKTYRKINKPILITIGCLLGALNVILSLSCIKYTPQNTDYFIINNLFAFICLIGIWKMKIWAIFTYISAFVVNQAILIFFNQWSAFQAILPVIVICIAIRKIDKMS